MKIFITGESDLLGSTIAEVALEKGLTYFLSTCNYNGGPVKFDLANPGSVVKSIDDVR